MIRSVLAFGLLLVTLCASANAATVHRYRPPVSHLRLGPRVTVPERFTAPERFTVPGWTEEQTRYWLSFPQVTG
jgi:hypothetical protein